ncbi:MAG: glycosyl transferase [Thermoplasmata archaeon M9B2D]|nr:MAG: glycosyl transferase [Thermoplasmata archaeon M9B2D]
MRDLLSKVILVSLDASAIFTAVCLAYLLREALDSYFFATHSQPLANYTGSLLVYLAVLGMLAYEGAYTRRYDFWHESRQILKALSFAFLIVMAYLAMTKSVEAYSRAVIIFAFFFMGLTIPLFKNIGKKLLFRAGIWRREAKVYGNDPFIVEEIFRNHYLGYVEANRNEPKTVFVNSKEANAKDLRRIIDQQIQSRHEVVFIPLMDEYDLTQSHVYELSNTRTNLIVFQNRLKSRYRIWLKELSDFVLFLIAFPLLLPLMAFIAYKIKKEEPKGSIFFKQERMGKDNGTFICYKFRTMAKNGNELLERYLKEHPKEIQAYAKYHKYENDPRITKIGHFLRKTSLDELPQIFNVLKGEMSFVGPRPYMLNEKEKIGDSLETILTVKPGITGLWQVNGRSEVDFISRVELDIWYIRNWNLWMDLVILLKTVKTVLIRKGAS